MIPPVATIVTTQDMLAGFATMALLCIPLMALFWMVRVMFSLRTRLDSIEDKLDLVLLAQQLEATSKKAPNKPDNQTEKASV